MGRSVWIGIALVAMVMGMMRRKRRSRVKSVLGYGRRIIRSMDAVGMTNMSARYLSRAGRRMVRAMAR